MCNSCPFKPKSKYFHLRDDWGNTCDEQMTKENMPKDGSVAHGCNEIYDDEASYDSNTQCIGHLDWIKGIKHS
jgi:hypothetical protein